MGPGAAREHHQHFRARCAQAAQQAQAQRTDVPRGGFGSTSRHHSIHLLMQRHSLNPRPDWREKVEEIGLTYHSHEEGPYWDESACYELTARGGERARSRRQHAASPLHRGGRGGASKTAGGRAWAFRTPPSRAFCARGSATTSASTGGSISASTAAAARSCSNTTPTRRPRWSRPSVAQWFWLQELHPDADQFNSIHERLIEAWRRWAGSTIHFSSVKEHPEDEQTVLYLRDTCEQAGVETRSVYIEDIGWDAAANSVSWISTATRSNVAFKLYPWEWLWHEEFGPHLAVGPPFSSSSRRWKMLLSNKGLLPHSVGAVSRITRTCSRPTRRRAARRALRPQTQAEPRRQQRDLGRGRRGGRGNRRRLRRRRPRLSGARALARVRRAPAGLRRLDR